MKNIAYSTVRTACDGITRHMSSVGMRHTSQKTWNNPARAMTHATVSSAMGFHEAILRHLAPTRMRVGMITGEWSLGGGNTMVNKRIDIGTTMENLTWVIKQKLIDNLKDSRSGRIPKRWWTKDYPGLEDGMFTGRTRPMKNVRADIGEYIWDSLQQSLGGPGDVVGVSENISVRAWVWTNCAVMDEIEHGINLSHQHYMEWSE